MHHNFLTLSALVSNRGGWLVRGGTIMFRQGFLNFRRVHLNTKHFRSRIKKLFAPTNQKPLSKLWQFSRRIFPINQENACFARQPVNADL